MNRDMTPVQRRKRASIERRLRKLLVEARDLAVDMGCRKPYLYYECEGQLHVMDDADVPDAGTMNESTVSLQSRVVVDFDLCGRRVNGVPKLDCGAW